MSQLQYDAAYLGDAPISEQSDKIDEALSGPKGHWPRLIVLNDETKQRLKMWLDNEIEYYNLERGPLLEDWKRWQTLYWAEPAQKERTFPFKRAANIVI